jgi:hypothetical protein
VIGRPETLALPRVAIDDHRVELFGCPVCSAVGCQITEGGSTVTGHRLSLLFAGREKRRIVSRRLVFGASPARTPTAGDGVGTLVSCPDTSFTRSAAASSSSENARALSTDIQTATPALDHCSNAYLARLSAARAIKPAKRRASQPRRHDS